MATVEEKNIGKQTCNCHFLIGSTSTLVPLKYSKARPKIPPANIIVLDITSPKFGMINPALRLLLESGGKKKPSVAV